jgi:ribonuclease-3
VDKERLHSLKELESRLGYRFNDVAFLDRALTHKSFVHESKTPPLDPSEKLANEVLEFLGDAVLTLAVSHLLTLAFPDADEGILSLKRSHLVRQSTLAHLTRELQLEQHLLLGKGELLNGGRKKSSILSNTYEALIGAIYMDSGFPQAMDVIERHLAPYLQSETNRLHVDDHKSLLQEHAQRLHKQSPKYHVLDESGPDHDKRFQASAVIAGQVRGIGWGRSKKEAEQEAAKKALEELQASNDSVDSLQQNPPPKALPAEEGFLGGLFNAIITRLNFCRRPWFKTHR